MRLAEDLLGSTPDLLRLLARTDHLNLNRWDLVRLQRVAVNYLHF